MRLIGRRSGKKGARVVSRTPKPFVDDFDENGEMFQIQYTVDDGKFGTKPKYEADIMIRARWGMILSHVVLNPDGTITIQKRDTREMDIEPADYPKMFAHVERRLKEAFARDEELRAEYAMVPEYAVIHSLPGGERIHAYETEVARYPTAEEAIARAEAEWAKVPEDERRAGHLVMVRKYVTPFRYEIILSLYGERDFKLIDRITRENKRQEVKVTKKHINLANRLETYWKKSDPVGYQMADEGSMGSPYCLILDQMQIGSVYDIIDRLKMDAGLFPRGSTEEKRRLELIQQLSALPVDDQGRITGKTYGDYRSEGAQKAAETRRRKAEAEGKTSTPKPKAEPKPRKAPAKTKKKDAPATDYKPPDWWYLSHEIYRIYTDYDPFNSGGDLMDYLTMMVTEPKYKSSLIWELRSNAEKFAEFDRPDLSEKLLALIPRVQALTYEEDR